MGRTRITAVILALAAALMVTAPAAAHPGATVFNVTSGVTSQVLVLVPADYGKAIDTIVITAPPSYRLDRAGTITSGWHVTKTARTVTFTGAVIAANDSAVFSLTGAATTKGELIFPVTTHSPDGTVMQYQGGPGAKDAGVVLFAGSRSHKVPWKPIAIALIVVVGAAGTLWIIWQRRRGGAGWTPSRD